MEGQYMGVMVCEVIHIDAKFCIIMKWRIYRKSQGVRKSYPLYTQAGMCITFFNCGKRKGKKALIYFILLLK